MSVHRSKAQSLLIVTVAYVVAVAAGAAWLLWGPSATGSLLLDAFIADVLATLVIFIFSRAYRNSSFYDAFWSVIPPLLLVYWWAAGPLGLDSLRCWLVAIVVMYWAVRLTGNWVLRLPRPAPRRLALPAAARRRGALGVRRRPLRHPPGPHRAGVPRHAAGLRRGHHAG